MSNSYKAIRSCRSCGSRRFKRILNLGVQFVSDFLPVGKEPKLKAPLNLLECQTCGLVQLEHTVNRDLIYKHYYYRSGTNEVMRKALKDVVHATCTRGRCRETRPLWVDIGANDGTLLQEVPSGFIRIGFEPATNLCKEANNPPLIFVYNDYFKKGPVLKDFGKADKITAVAMFYDLDDPNKFLEDIKAILAEDGIFVIQQNYLPTMIEKNIYDNIGHEHVCFYSLATLTALLKRHDLEVFDVELNDVNGGSFRTFVCHKDAYQISENVPRLAAYEGRVMAGTVYQLFRERIEEGRRKLVGFLTAEARKGKVTYGYGASNRGSTILQYCGITNELLPKIADRNPEKHGRRMLNIPIISEERMRKDKPAYLLVLPYFYLSAFCEREKKYLSEGGALIVPVPTPRVIRLENGETKNYPI